MDVIKWHANELGVINSVTIVNQTGGLTAQLLIAYGKNNQQRMHE